MDLLLASKWQASTFHVLARRVLTTFPGYTERVALRGLNVAVGPSAAFALALTVYELVANAVRFGSSSSSGGAADLSWEIGGEGANEISVAWAERGGPRVKVPDQPGFGTSLVCTAVSRSLRGRAELNFAESGITWSLTAPVAALEA